ncbi:MAG: iron-containing alcohol dehydrogenase [Deltaproteobacteria bacterium]|nr:iron-containing alcohol dehydrogenase [Deltaproteobacteria bacterium]MBW2121381.1 iron-containing alcohol dehydrogenase [Deltaproteobacteria bacterium]
MEEISCNLPVRVVFGVGKLKLLGEVTEGFGRKAFLVIDPYLDKTGVSEEVLSTLRKNSVEAVKFTDVRPNPVCSEIDKGAELAREQKCEVVIGVGGGSALDTAKGIATLAKNPGKVWDYVERTDQEVSRPRDVLPVIAVPTTAGTGSEVTLYAVINNPDVREKSTIYSDLIFPRVALVDPELMVSMPPRLTALTGIDALSHSVESFINIHANSYSKLLAKESIRIAARYLPEAVANGGNMEARSKMAWASTLGGMAISHVGTTLPHALGQPVSGLVDAPHGGSIASCLARILQFSFTSDFERFAELAEAFDESVGSLPLRERAEKSGDLAQRLVRDVDCEVGFGDFGLQEKDIDKATQVAMSAYFIDLGNHPRKVGEEEIKKLYRECL